MSNRINDAFRAYCTATAADPMPDLMSPEWIAWQFRESERVHGCRLAVRLAQVDEEFERQIEDAEVARLCEAEVYPS